MSFRTVGTVITCLAFVAWFWSRGERFIAANGPTFDETVQLASGYGYWRAGEFQLNNEEPPLLKLLWSAPLLFGNAPPFPPEVSPERQSNSWHVGIAWAYNSGVPAQSLIEPARRVNLALGSALVLLVGWIAYRAWGSRLAGLAGSAFAAADPTVLAMSCVLKTDLGVALFALLTCYLLWEYAAKPSPRLLVVTGLSTGLLLGAKFSALGMAAAIGVAALLYVAQGGTLALPGKASGGGGFRSRFGLALELAIRLAAIAIVTVAATYAFVHFPDWASGLKFQLARSGNGGDHCYLNGQQSYDGWYHYFLVALPLKLPLGLLIAAGISALSLLACAPAGQSERRWRYSAFFLVPPLVFFALASYSRVNLGVRVVLPFVPFLYVLAAGLARGGYCRFGRWTLLAGCLAACGVASQRASPHELTFFNELVGGPRHGLAYLADSNVDWGQGLPELKRWMDANGVEAIYLGYFGTDRPEAHGIRYDPLPGYGRVGPYEGTSIPAHAARHIVAVSASHLVGLHLNDPDTYSWLRNRTPIAIPAHCVYVFDLTGDPAAIERVRTLAPR
jgi:Dolichyl-phosphate-mannose-protein mannosyltransferase